MKFISCDTIYQLIKIPDRIKNVNKIWIRWSGIYQKRNDRSLMRFLLFFSLSLYEILKTCSWRAWISSTKGNFFIFKTQTWGFIPLPSSEKTPLMISQILFTFSNGLLLVRHSVAKRVGKRTIYSDRIAENWGKIKIQCFVKKIELVFFSSVV